MVPLYNRPALHSTPLHFSPLLSALNGLLDAMRCGAVRCRGNRLDSTEAQIYTLHSVNVHIYMYTRIQHSHTEQTFRFDSIVLSISDIFTNL